MPRTNPEQPLVILCELCRRRLPTTRATARYDRIDHALDAHRDRLLATPNQALRLFRVVHPDNRPARLVASPIGHA